MKEVQTTKSQTKPPVDREAVRVLAIELGAREAARRLNLNPNTVLSWARRYNLKLPDRRDIGRPAINPSALSLQSGDVVAPARLGNLRRSLESHPLNSFERWCRFAPANYN